MTTLAFTRPLRRLDESVVIAREYGFDVIAAPSLDIVHGRSEDYSDIKKKLKDRAFSTVIFSSRNRAHDDGIFSGIYTIEYQFVIFIITDNIIRTFI